MIRNMISVTIKNPESADSIIAFPGSVDQALNLIQSSTTAGGSVSVEISGESANDLDRILRQCLPEFNFTSSGIEESLEG